MEHSGNDDCRGRENTDRFHQQAVYSSRGKLVTTEENKGTYDYSPPEVSLIDHGTLDVVPWYYLGNSPQDSTTEQGRRDAFPFWNSAGMWFVELGDADLYDEL